MLRQMHSFKCLYYKEEAIKLDNLIPHTMWVSGKRELTPVTCLLASKAGPEHLHVCAYTNTNGILKLKRVLVSNTKQF